MNKQPTLKQFAQKVINHRRRLIKKGYGFISPELKQEMKNIAYNLDNCNTTERVANYMKLKKEVFQYIIPANKKSWHQKFEELIEA